VNLLGDPAKILNEDSYADGVAGILARGESAVNVSNLNERLLQKGYVNRLTNPLDVVVIGSSRAMQIGRASLPVTCTLHNSGVSGAILADDMAIYGLYRLRKVIPRTVILGVDPWIFNAGLGKTGSYLSLSESYISVLAAENAALPPDPSLRLSIVKFQLKKYLQLISPSYFQASLRSLCSGIGRNAYYSASDSRRSDDALIRSDGTYGYDRSFRSQTLEAVRRSAVQYAHEKDVYNLYSFGSISSELRERFEEFVGLMRSDGVRVVLFLPPYHPAVYPELISRADTKIITEVEAYVRKFAADNDLLLVGGYAPSPIKMGESDFYDGMHLKPGSIRKIFPRANYCSPP
jgi:hypothetical protein